MNSRVEGLGMFQLYSYIVGTTVGVGWIVATGYWLETAGTLGSVIAFLIGGTVMWMIGLCFAELMSMYPDSAGSTGYVYEAFGENAAAVTGWLLVLTYASTCAWLFVTVGWLIDTIFPALSQAVHGKLFGAYINLSDLLLGAVAALFITAVNIRGIAARSGVQDILVVLKIALGSILIAAACLWGEPSRINETPVLGGPKHGSSYFFAGIIVVAASTPFFFSGFDVLPQVLRDRNSGLQLKKLGRLMGLTMVTCFVFYIGIILACTMAMDHAGLVASELPVFAAFSTGLESPVLGKIVIITGLTGVVTAWSANLLSGARLLQALADAGSVPTWLANNKRCATAFPTRVVRSRGLILVSVLGITLGLLGREGLGPIINICAISLYLTFLIVCLSLIKLRRSAPDNLRPYRVSGDILVPSLAILFSVLLLTSSLLAALEAGSSLIHWGVVGWWCVFGVVFRYCCSGRRLLMSEQDRKAFYIMEA